MAENETPKVGDKVYADFGRYSRVDVREGKVIKITPTGRVNVDFGNKYAGTGDAIIYQFKDGRLVGGGQYHAPRLIAREVDERLLVDMRRNQALRAFNDARSSNRPESKPEALALVEKLRVLADAIPA